MVKQVPLPGSMQQIDCTVYAPQVVPNMKPGLIIHLYGSGGSHQNFNAGRPPYEAFRKLVSERGDWLVVPDLGPAHWMNEEACCRIDAVINEWVNHEGVDPKRVHLLGTSMGGGSSLIYVMRRPGKIKSVAAIFPMTDFNLWLEEMPAYRQRVENAHQVSESNREAVLRSISPIHNLEAFRDCPVFLLHGVKDPIVPVHHSRRFAEGLKMQGAAVSYDEVDDEVHRDEIAMPYQLKIADFLTRTPEN